MASTVDSRLTRVLNRGQIYICWVVKIGSNFAQWGIEHASLFPPRDKKLDRSLRDFDSPDDFQIFFAQAEQISYAPFGFV